MTTRSWSLRPSTPADAGVGLRAAQGGARAGRRATWGDEQLQRRMFDERFTRDGRAIIRVGDDDVGALAIDERPDELYVGLIDIARAVYERAGLRVVACEPPRLLLRSRCAAATPSGPRP